MKKLILVLFILLSITTFGLTANSAPLIKKDASACMYIVPSISRVTPEIVYPGQTVIVDGNRFQPGGLAVYYGNDKYGWAKLNAQYVNSSRVSFIAPSQSIPDSLVYVQTCGGISNIHSFSVIVPNRR